MADHPILFSGPMVRALLDGRKTQTRRVVKPQPHSHMPGMWRWSGKIGSGWGSFQPDEDGMGRALRTHAVRHDVGHRLYVREAWRSETSYDDLSPSAMGGDEPIRYEADSSHQTWGYPAISRLGRFRQGRHMPRWASRLTLIVTDVRVQRVQEISEADAWAEGIRPPCETMTPTDAMALCRKYGTDHAGVASFADLWDSLNAKRGYGWDVNPWVVAVTFTVERRNIDQMEPTDD